MQHLQVQCTEINNAHISSIADVTRVYDIDRITILPRGELCFDLRLPYRKTSEEFFTSTTTNTSFTSDCDCTFDILVDVEDWFQFILSGEWPQPSLTYVHLEN